MALTKTQKQKIIADLQDLFIKQKIMIFVNFYGLKSKETLNLRRKLKEQNCLLGVSKKTLIKLALKNSKIEFWQKIDEIPGQLGIVFGFGDEITPARVVYEFSKENENLKILGGILESQKHAPYRAEGSYTGSKLPEGVASRRPYGAGKSQKYEFLSSEEIIELAKLPGREELLARFTGTILSPISNFISVLQGNIKGLIFTLSAISKSK